MSDSTEQRATQTLIPIVIGVTGHRDLRREDLADLQEAVGKIFKEFRELYPSTPLVLLTSLAEGADRLAARVALDNKASIIVPLPMPAEEYQVDFKDSVEEFCELLDQAQDWFVVPATNDGSGANDREKAYTRASQYIAGHCQVLIALWDGQSNGPTGGTAHTVYSKLEGDFSPNKHVYDLFSWNNQGPVYQIVTPRLSNPLTANHPLSLNIIYPSSWEGGLKAAEFNHQVLGNINSFNENLVKLFPNIKKEIEVSKGQIISLDQVSRVPPWLLFLRDIYAEADCLANWFQKRRNGIMISLFILAVLSLLFFELYAHAFPNLPVVLALYPATLGIAYLLFVRAKHYRYQDRHLDYRTLAEGLRVQFFWEIAGVREGVSDYYLPRHQGELVWLRYALRNIKLSMNHTGQSAYKPDLDAMHLVIKNWVTDQANFFSGRHERDNTRENRQKYWTLGLFLGGLVVAVIYILLSTLLPNNHYLEAVHAPIIISIVLAAASAAALEGYAEKMAFSEQAKQYHRMSSLFNDALSKLNFLLEDDELEKAQLLIRELGQEALRENGDWLLMHRERPMKVPITG